MAVRARRPHPRRRRLLDLPNLDVFPGSTIAEAQRWATEIGVPAYAIDDQTAIKVTGGTVEVVSEGRWKQFPG